MMPFTLSIAGNRESMLIAVFYFVLALSLYSDIHLWVLLLCICASVVRLFLFLGWYNHMPGKRTVNLLALLAGVALITTSGNMDFLHTMVNLLLLACALKLMLLGKRRDFYQLFICGIFLLACGYIFYQSLGRSVFYAGLLLCLLYILLSAHSPSKSRRVRQRKTLILALQALPITLMLFMFMPRIPPLWKMPEGQSTETGLAEKITPGDIANLAQSEKLAFSATFKAVVPPSQSRYWRALSLEHFDGTTWSVSETRQYARGQLQHLQREFSPSLEGEPIRYEIIAEPTKKTWLFAIDTAIPDSSASAREIWQGWDYQLMSLQPLFSRYSYHIASYPGALRYSGNPALDDAINLQLPDKGNPKTQQWVNTLRNQYPDDNAFAYQLMRYFKDTDFEYTLTPPTMAFNPVDTFLFEARRGFCAHYASAMAYAFRLAGIPARVVTGYQGGTPINEETINVYQYDAHAWVEAKINQQHWQRFDPTTVVAPSRIFEGFEHAARFSGEMQGEHPLNGLTHMGFFNYLRNMSAQMDYLWSRWFLGYNNEEQEGILEQLLGKITTTKLTVFALGLFASTVLLLTIYFVPSWRRQRIDKVKRHYLKAVSAIENQYHLPRGNRSPRQYYGSCLSVLPAPVADALYLLTTLYEAHEYAPHMRPPLDKIKAASRQVCQQVRNTAPR